MASPPQIHPRQNETSTRLLGPHTASNLRVGRHDHPSGLKDDEEALESRRGSQPAVAVMEHLPEVSQHHALAREPESHAATSDSTFLDPSLPDVRLPANAASRQESPQRQSPPGPNNRYDSCLPTPTIHRWNTMTCEYCRGSGHAFMDHCFRCLSTGHLSADHCAQCDSLGHRRDDHCIQCREFGPCVVGRCVNVYCDECDLRGHHADSHCTRCRLIGLSSWDHQKSDHCDVCDIIFCKTENHCYVCAKTGHCSQDHCRDCRELGHTYNDHCVNCTQLGHDRENCPEPPKQEFCWICRSFGHCKRTCHYREQNKLRNVWAFRLKQRSWTEKDRCGCCIELCRLPKYWKHKLVDCPTLTHKVGCLEKSHDNPACKAWIQRSYADASMQVNLAEYSKEVDLRNFNKGKEKATSPTVHPASSIFATCSSSTQTAFVQEVVAREENHDRKESLDDFDIPADGGRRFPSEELGEPWYFSEPETTSMQQAAESSSDSQECFEKMHSNKDDSSSLEVSSPTPPISSYSQSATETESEDEDALSRDARQMTRSRATKPAAKRHITHFKVAKNTAKAALSIVTKQSSVKPRPAPRLVAVEIPVVDKSAWNITPLSTFYSNFPTSGPTEDETSVYSSDTPTDSSSVANSDSDSESGSHRDSDSESDAEDCITVLPPRFDCPEEENMPAPSRPRQEAYVLSEAPSRKLAVRSRSLQNHEGTQIMTQMISRKTANIIQGVVLSTPNASKIPRSVERDACSHMRFFALPHQHNQDCRSCALSEALAQARGRKRPRMSRPTKKSIDKRQKTDLDPDTPRHKPAQNSQLRQRMPVDTGRPLDYDCQSAPSSTSTVLSEAIPSHNVDEVSDFVQQATRGTTMSKAVESDPCPEPLTQTAGRRNAKEPKSGEALAEKRQKTKTDLDPGSHNRMFDLELTQPATPMSDTPDTALEGGSSYVPTSQFKDMLPGSFHRLLKGLVYTVMLNAPDHSSNFRQLGNLVKNRLFNIFPRCQLDARNEHVMSILKFIIEASPCFTFHQQDPFRPRNNPIQFSLCKNATTKAANLKADLKSNLMLYEILSGIDATCPHRMRSEVSYENIIGIALCASADNRLTEPELLQWIRTNAYGYQTIDDDWESQAREQLQASSFFKKSVSDPTCKSWTFEEDCSRHFTGWDLAWLWNPDC